MLLSLLIVGIFLPFSVLAQTSTEDPHAQHTHHAHHQMHHEHNGMRMDMGGSVMNENVDQLPQDCPRLAGEQSITVRAGRKYAQPFLGTMFSYDQREWDVNPCTKVTVTFVNEDNVRHQWMIHGLPRYLYPEGMFHVEVNGQGSETGTFIVPSSRKTYLVHCDVAQHMEKGMKAQLKIGGGNGDLPSIPGVSRSNLADVYPVRWTFGSVTLLLMAALLGTGGTLFALRKFR